MDKIKKAFKKVEEYETPQYLSDIAYYITKDRKLAERVYKIVKTAVCWVVFMDFYEETREKEYGQALKEQHRILYRYLNNPQIKVFQKLEINIVNPYWKYEKVLKNKIENNYEFPISEIEESIFRRSGDSKLYGTLLSFFCNFPPEAVRVLHNRQAFEDILDCLEDYSEDLERLEPNILFMYLLNQRVPNQSFPKTLSGLRKSIYWGSIKKNIIKFLEKHYAESRNISSKLDIPILSRELDAQNKLLTKTLLAG